MHFLGTDGCSRNDLEEILRSAFEYKNGSEEAKPLAGRSVALVFFNPSLRTRASMQIGIQELGGNTVIIEPGGSSWTLEHREGAVMDGDKTEHLADFVHVLERYVSAIGVRTFAALKDWETERTDPILNAFAKYASIPVINLESAMHHPCQALADMMTIREMAGETKKQILLTWAWHPKALPMAVANSFALSAAQFGHDLRIAYPRGYDLDEELLAEIERQVAGNDSNIEYTNDIDGAFDGVEVVYAKSWGSSSNYGKVEGEIMKRAEYRDKWIVDAEKMSRTNGAAFMHCLPVRRNVIVTDDVIDGPRSVVLDQAENRLYVQKAILSHLMSAKDVENGRI